MNVYILKAGPYFKVGKANHIQSRIDQLQTGCPFPIKCVAYLKHNLPHSVESRIHNQYQSQRAAGEWFALSESHFQEIVAAYEFIVCIERIGWSNSGSTIDAVIAKNELKTQKITNKANASILWARYEALYAGLLSSTSGTARIAHFKLNQRSYLKVLIREVVRDLVEIDYFPNESSRRRMHSWLNDFEQEYKDSHIVYKISGCKKSA